MTSCPMPIAAAKYAPSDDNLADRLKRHELRSMGDLYDRYAAPVYSIVRRIVWDAGDAEDVVQEIFLRVWNRAHLLDRSKGVLTAWVLTVARNVAIDTIRAARRKAPLTPLEDLPDGRMFDAEIVHLNRIRVERALQNLDSNQRLVIELAYFEGLSHTEIAQKLNRPLGTIKSWVRGALMALRGPVGQEVASSAAATTLGR